MSKRKKPEEPKSLLEFVDCEQGSEEWFYARLGLPTASMFHVILGDDEKVTRGNYLNRLAGEIITGMPAESYESAAMRRGKEMEGQARAAYTRRTGRDLKMIGLARNFSGLKRCGASPDALIGFDGGLETKTMKPELMIPLLEKGARMVPKHRAQVHGNMWVTERDWWDLSIYYPKMPPYIVRVERDETYIRQISDAVERFNYDLKQLVERLRNMGAE